MDTITLNWKKYNNRSILLVFDDTILKFIPPYVNKPKLKYVNLFLALEQDKKGGRTVTFPDNIRWLGGKVPILSKLPNAIDVIAFYYCKIHKAYYATYSLNMRRG